MEKPITLSFELFPPHTEVALSALRETVLQLNTCYPDYFSVTFGASGSNQEKTLRAVKQLVDERMTVAPHLTCIGLRRENIRSLLQHYIDLGIANLVAIRGDLPEGEENLGDFQYANELVDFIRQETGDHFNIKVAAYPEFHPQAVNAVEDLKYFKNKVAMGANCAITQFFFNIDAYYQLREVSHKMNIHTPIIPGIMPIGDFNKLREFARRCGSEIPLWICKRVESYGEDTHAIQQFGIELITKLCQDLLNQGAPGLHFYTLNRLDPTSTIVKNLGINLIKKDLGSS